MQSLRKKSSKQDSDREILVHQTYLYELYLLKITKKIIEHLKKLNKDMKQN